MVHYGRALCSMLLPQFLICGALREHSFRLIIISSLSESGLVEF